MCTFILVQHYSLKTYAIKANLYCNFEYKKNNNTLLLWCLFNLRLQWTEQRTMSVNDLILPYSMQSLLILAKESNYIKSSVLTLMYFFNKRRGGKSKEQPSYCLFLLNPVIRQASLVIHCTYFYQWHFGPLIMYYSIPCLVFMNTNRKILCCRVLFWVGGFWEASYWLLW